MTPHQSLAADAARTAEIKREEAAMQSPRYPTQREAAIRLRKARAQRVGSILFAIFVVTAVIALVTANTGLAVVSAIAFALFTAQCFWSARATGIEQRHPHDFVSGG